MIREWWWELRGIVLRLWARRPGRSQHVLDTTWYADDAARGLGYADFADYSEQMRQRDEEWRKPKRTPE